MAPGPMLDSSQRRIACMSDGPARDMMDWNVVRVFLAIVCSSLRAAGRALGLSQPTIARLTRALNIRHPIVLAPMAFASRGTLAAAVNSAGGLGLIGGGYGDAAWLEEQFAAAGGECVGVGFITWSLSKSPALLTAVLSHNPRAVMPSFGDPRPFVDEIRAAGAALICQCQNMNHVADAIEAHAEITSWHKAPKAAATENSGARSRLCRRLRIFSRPVLQMPCCWPQAVSATGGDSRQR